MEQLLKIETKLRCQFVDITARVRSLVHDAGVEEGSCLLFVHHTTASLTINENNDPDVHDDILTGLADLLGDERRYRHDEGNSGGTPTLIPVGCFTHHSHN